MSGAEVRRQDAVLLCALVFGVLDFFSGGLLSSPLGWVLPSMTPSRRLALLGAGISIVPLWRRFSVLPPERRRLWPWALGAGLCLGVAVATRFLTLTWDSSHGPDGYEALFLNPVLEMMRTGDLNHRYHEYPGLFLYLLAGTFILAFMVGISRRLGINLADMPSLVFLEAGRAMVALSSVLTVALTMGLGRLYGGWSTGLLAASLVCLSPLEIDTSQLIRPDVTLEMFAVLSLILTVRALESGTLTATGLAGLAVGLTTAIKYTGFLTLPALLFACLFAAGSIEQRLKRFALAIAATLAAYAAASPYSLLDLPGFINGLAEQGRYNTDPALRPDDNMPLFYSRVLASRGIGPLALAFMVLGLVRTLKSPKTRDWILIVYAACYLQFFFSAPVQFDRFMLPCIPVLAIWAARGVEGAWSLAPSPGFRRTALIVTTSLALLLPSAVRTGLYLRARMEPSPRDAVAAFLDTWTGRDASARIAVSRLGPSLDEKSFVVGRFVVFNPRTAPMLSNFDYLVASAVDSKTTLQPFRLLRVFEPAAWGTGHFQALYEVPDHLRARYTPLPGSDIRLSSAAQPERLGAAADGNPRTVWRGRSSESDDVTLSVDLGRTRALGQIELIVPPEGAMSLDSLIIESVSDTEVVEVLDRYVLKDKGRVRVFLPETSVRRLRIRLPKGQRRTLAIAEISFLERMSRKAAPSRA